MYLQCECHDGQLLVINMLVINVLVINVLVINVLVINDLTCDLQFLALLK